MKKTMMKLTSVLFALVMALGVLNFSGMEVGAALIGDDYPYRGQTSGYDPWGMVKSQCTSFVAWRLTSANGYDFNRAGKSWNAYEWGGNARSMGNVVDMNPAIGSVAWSTAGTYGHVAWVAEVNGDSITIEEYNVNSDRSYHYRTVNKSNFSGYIHFKDINVAPTIIPSDFIDVTNKIANRKISLKSVANGNYVKADLYYDNAPMIASSTEALAWEQFTTELTGDGHIGFKNIESNKYITADISSLNAPLSNTADIFSLWECFRIFTDGTYYYLRSVANGYWVTSDIEATNSPLLARASVPSGWERFYIVCQDNHAFDEWITTVYTTETTSGVRERTCSICGYKETQIIEKIIPLAGDLNQDKELSITDFVILKKYLLGKQNLTEETFTAADLNSDNTVNAVDLAIMKYLVLSK
jgi:surface antigen